VDQEFDWQIVPRVTRQKWRNPNAPPTPAIQAADGDYLDDDPPTKPKSRAPRTFKPGKKAGRPKKVILQTVATAVPVTRLPDIFEEVMSHVAKMGESVRWFLSLQKMTEMSFANFVWDKFLSLPRDITKCVSVV
jgi:hypothetical protein